MSNSTTPMSRRQILTGGCSRGWCYRTIHNDFRQSTQACEYSRSAEKKIKEKLR